MRRMGYPVRMWGRAWTPCALRAPTGLRAALRRVHPYGGLLPLLARRGRTFTRAVSPDIDVQRVSMTRVYLRLDG